LKKNHGHHLYKPPNPLSQIQTSPIQNLPTEIDYGHSICLREMSPRATYHPRSFPRSPLCAEERPLYHMEETHAHVYEEEKARRRAWAVRTSCGEEANETKGDETEGEACASGVHVKGYAGMEKDGV